MKAEKMSQNQVDISSDGESSKETIESALSERLDTQALTTMIATRKEEQKLKLKETESQEQASYRWKLSVVKHRRQHMLWGIFIIVIALYSVLVIPIRIGINESLLDPAYIWIDLITWLIYVTDVLVNVRTTYIDNYGHEVVDNKKIAMKYMKSMRFYIDVLSLLNLPHVWLVDISMQAGLALNALGLLKLSRYFRAQGLIV